MQKVVQKNWYLSLLLITGLLFVVSARAQESAIAGTDGEAAPQAPVDDKTSGWHGSAELGIITTRGNTETDSLNMQTRVEHLRAKWRHALQLRALRASDQGEATAENYEGLWRTEYLINANDYLFGNLRYEDDRFAGYDYRASGILGYGHQFLKRPDMTLKGEFGLGSRYTKNTDASSESEATLRLGLDYSWKLTPTSTFREVVFVEHGEENTFTESVTELSVRINNKLAMKLGLTVRNNSNPPLATKNTDTRSAVTLVYDF